MNFNPEAVAHAGMATRKPYPSDVSDEEWAFVAPYLALVREDAPQRNHDLRQEVFNGLRWIVRIGSAWRYMPHDFLPPWGSPVYQQTQRWLKGAGIFEEMVHDLRILFLRLSEGRAPDPTATILDYSRTLQSTPESGSQGGYDGAKRKKGSREGTRSGGHFRTPSARLACDTSQRAGARACVGKLVETVQEEVTGETVELWHTWTKDIPERG